MVSEEQKKDIADRKKRFLAYYAELPVFKLAAGHIGRTDDTILTWRRDDAVFSEQIEQARSDWAQRQSKGVRSKEWLLERVMKDHFAQRQEVTGKDGESLQIEIIEDKHIK